jgi:septal ring factor EnvC (AmiA/AmiB activator)
VADIFISYSKEQPQPTRDLAAYLESEGYSVWWDTGLKAGERFGNVIDRELDAAKAVIVIWTAHSVTSDWVLAEAEHAYRDRKLIPLRTRHLDTRRIPKPYNILHSDAVDDRAAILAAVKRIVGVGAYQATMRSAEAPTMNAPKKDDGSGLRSVIGIIGNKWLIAIGALALAFLVAVTGPLILNQFGLPLLGVTLPSDAQLRAELAAAQNRLVIAESAAKTAEQHLAEVERAAKASKDAEQTLSQRIAAAEKERDDTRKDAATARTALDAAQKDLSAAKQQRVDERQIRLAEVEQAIAAERQRAAALARQADNLKDLIGKLESASDGAKRTGQASTRSSDESKTPNGAQSGLAAALNDPARMAPAIAFVSAKGRLSLPVSGIKVRDFRALDAAGNSEKGISIATRPGAQVTAPTEGWVVYAAPYRSYGQLLILNVGGGYHVLLAGMERITVDPGQFVRTGEPVAVMGSGTRVTSAAGASSEVGSSQQPLLYVEFRKDGTPIDSSPWWAATANE